MNSIMEPGDYLTNVISFNDYAAINYDYYEAEKLSPPGAAKRHLQRLELGWRQEGRLVHYDSMREGLWLFQKSSNGPTTLPVKEVDPTSLRVDIRGVGVVQKDKGTYEPASLVRTKTTTPNTMTTPGSGTSPSTPLEASIRKAQAQNTRSVQQNSGLGASQDSSTLSPGTKSTSSLDMGASLKEIHEFFISAVLGSLVYFLCRQQNFIPLNSRTLILAPPSATEEKSAMQVYPQLELATLDISLTSLGVLVVKAHTDLAPGLQSLPRSLSNIDLNEGTSLWLAPSGNAAKFHSISEDGKNGGMTSVLQSHSNVQEVRFNTSSNATIKSWQSKCLDWLSAKGLNTAVLEAGGWLYVQITGGSSPYWNHENSNTSTLEELTIIPWPALLCFQTSNGASRDSQQTCTINSTFRDPLAFAEDWFVGKDERANILVKRQKEHQAAEARSREQADIDTRNFQSNIYSPSVRRRGSIAGAMYPTPPDAPLLGATPNFDGNVSSPGMPNHFGPLAAGISTTGADIDVDVWTSTKKTRPGAAGNFNENSAESDNLFGESMEADMFGTDIIEADFDFFDGPDSVPAENNVSSPIVPILPYVQDMSTKEGAIIFNDKSFHTDTHMHDGVEDAYQHTPHEVPAMPLQARSGSPVQTTQLPSDNTAVILSCSPPRSRKERSPFNQETIFSKLSQKHTDKGPLLRRSSSLFNKIPFENALASVNAKYGVNGQFQFTMQRKVLPASGQIELPRTGYLSARQKARENRQESVYIPHVLVDTAPAQQNDPMDYLVESDIGSQASEQDDTSNTTDGTSPILYLQPKRKYDIDEVGDMSTLDTVAMDFENSVETPQSISGSQMPYLDPDPADWSLATYFTSLEPDFNSTGLSDVECIASAQILADQAVSGTFRVPGIAATDVIRKRDRVCTTRELMHGLARAAKSCLNDHNVCSMRTFLEIQGIPVLNQGLRLPPRLQPPRVLGLELARPNNPFSLPPPQLEVRRADTKLTILPSAVTFWENLGLGPSQGPKDINAVCAFPNIEGAATNANIFLDQMRSAYESSRFGNHDRATCKEVINGLVGYSLDPLQQHRQPYAVAMEEIIAQLLKLLISLMVTESNFVVYFVYPNDNGALLVQICAAFKQLFEMYKRILSGGKARFVNELVLQLVPMDFIASHTTLAVPSPTDYFRVAMEVYDRCFDFTSSTTSPAIMLERPLPKIIDFKLTSNPSASVLQENTCLHVAYARSIDERWITAAWTDNRGTQQMTASYCLGRKNEPLSMSFSEVANEIWETTIDYISSKKIHWRIMVAKIGVMDPSEIEMWTDLAVTEVGAQASLTLITVHTDPSLRLLPVPTVLNPSGTSANPGNTPGSTPQSLQSSIVSPDTATGTADTPLETDGDSRLVDLTDQSWGAVLGHRLNNSNSLVDLNLALISGYLIKRGSMNNEQPPIVMEVNIVHSEVVGNPRTFHESLLKEVLLCYRGLGSLARVRGVVDPVRDVRPWHVAAAEKAVKALYMLM